MICFLEKIFQKSYYMLNYLKTVIILIVGLGSMGKRRIRCFKKLGFSKIIGLDPRTDRRKEVEKDYKIETVSTISEALTKNPNCMIISTPPDLHYRYASIAIKNNIHFFTEVNIFSKDVAKIIKKLQRKTIVGVPSSTMLFHPIVEKLTKIMLEKKIGKVLTIDFHFGHFLPNWHPWEDYRKFYVSKKETGAAREIVPFELIWITKIISKVSSVYGNMYKLSNLDNDIDDIYRVFIEFKNGVKGMFVIDVFSEPAINETKIIGENGIIRCDHNLGIIKIGRGEKWKEIKIKTEKMAKGYKGNTPSDSIYEKEMKNFLNAIQKKLVPKFTFSDELEILKTLDAIEQSHKKSKKIIIPAKK